MADRARLAAYDVLRAVRTQDAYANLVLPQVLRDHGLSGRDAAFTTELVSGTLRHQGTYDAVVDACLDRGRVQGRVRDALRLGAHQLLGMRVGTHAAVSATVDLARARAGPRSSGLVNAVLRAVAAHDLDTWVARVAPDAVADPVGHLTIAHSHPRWVVEQLAQALGDRRGELPALLAADNQPPRVVLAARPGRARREELPGEPTVFSPYGVVLAGGDPGAVPAVAEGRAGVQDEGSQLVAHALAEARLEGADGRWLDACAGPGGKAALLAGLAAGRGASLVAAERQPHRAALVRRAVTGAAGAVGVVVADATRPAWAPGTFDRLLVDAPCSGLGALRRRPESRWRRQEGDLDDLVPLQRSLLDSAVDAVRPGGVVLYSTCSPVLAETAGVVHGVVTGRDDVRLEPVPLDVPDADGPLAGTAQLWPHRHGTDAMFLALLRRR
ncbi:MAG TPA: transcription antitermination factor NusB [Nocardioides sp.]|nr:transcription antitermination factor NusB [Nocardioides sp.]